MTAAPSRSASTESPLRARARDDAARPGAHRARAGSMPGAAAGQVAGSRWRGRRGRDRRSRPRGDRRSRRPHGRALALLVARGRAAPDCDSRGRCAPAAARSPCRSIRRLSTPTSTFITYPARSVSFAAWRSCRVRIACARRGDVDGAPLPSRDLRRARDRRDATHCRGAARALRPPSAGRCRATSAPGAFLSGGLDSSTVAGLMAERIGRGHAPSFSIGFDAEGYDEMEFARIAARHFGLSAHEHYLTPDEVLDRRAGAAARDRRAIRQLLDHGRLSLRAARARGGCRAAARGRRRGRALCRQFTLREAAASSSAICECRRRCAAA